MAFDWQKVVKGIAPLLGGMLLGPYGATAFSALAKGLLGKDDASEDEIAAKIQEMSARPEDLVKLKEIETNLIIKLSELNLTQVIRPMELEVEEKKSARELFKISVYPQIIFSGVFVLGYLVLLFYMLHKLFEGTDLKSLDPALLAMYSTVFGVMTAAVVKIIDFWFGSSFGSQRKTQIIAASSPPNGNGK